MIDSERKTGEDEKGKRGEVKSRNRIKAGRQCLEGKVQIDAGTNVFNARSVYRACSSLDDIQTSGHIQMKTFHQLLLMLRGWSEKPELGRRHANRLHRGIIHSELGKVICCSL